MGRLTEQVQLLSPCIWLRNCRPLPTSSPDAGGGRKTQVALEEPIKPALPPVDTWLEFDLDGDRSARFGSVAAVADPSEWRRLWQAMQRMFDQLCVSFVLNLGQLVWQDLCQDKHNFRLADKWTNVVVVLRLRLEIGDWRAQTGCSLHVSIDNQYELACQGCDDDLSPWSASDITAC